MLTKFQTKIQELSLMQNSWASEINPVIISPQNNSLILKNVSLTSGSNTINHKLGHTLNGWKIVRQRASASIYDNQDYNQSPELTLILITSADVIVDLEVF